MKTVFKVFGLEERNVITSAWLSSDGINTEEEMITFRLHQGNFDTELEAFKFIEECDGFEHGFEVIKVITN